MHASILRRSQVIVALSFCLFATSAAFGQSPLDAAKQTWVKSSAKAFQESRATGRPVVVFVGTNCCHFCKMMEHQTWSHPTIDQSIRQSFVGLKLDGDRDQQIVSQLGLGGYPATLVYAPDRKLIAKKEGFMAPTDTQQWLGQAQQKYQSKTLTRTALNRSQPR